MKRAILAIALVVATALIGRAPALAANGPVVLTVVGKIAKTNRAAFDAFRDAFIGQHDQKFAKGFAFDRAALKALPQTTVKSRAEGWPATVTASGPRLAAVLAAVGAAKDAVVTLVALDGYAVELEPAERDGHDWVLAVDADGAPLGIGGRGPAWLLYDSAGKTVSSDDEAAWVWSVFLIVVE